VTIPATPRRRLDRELDAYLGGMPRIETAPIDTERLLLEPLRVDHAEAMAAVLDDPQLHAFIGGAPSTAEQLRTRYARMLAGPEDPQGSWCNWVIRVRAEEGLAGTIQATVVPGPTGTTAEIAWVVGTGWQGRGLAKEAARALVAWLAERDVATVIAHVHPEHRASAAVAAAAGLAATDEVDDGEIRWSLRLRST
jgi:RimJ/RimL family protein N-acetyltransferase